MIKTLFGFSTTALEIVEGIDLTGKRAIVTGGASGIGIETARALASAGASVTIASRDSEAGAKAVSDIIESTSNRQVDFMNLDLSDRGSISSFVSKWSGPLHILINNAGVMAMPETRTAEGWEMQFATNHLGHFALAFGLHSALCEAGGARIVSVSSSAHQMSPVIFDDMHFRFRPYDPLLAYGQSKSANILFAVAATARWSRDGIYANSLMPGAIETNLQRYVGGIKAVPEKRKTPQQGAATSVLLAVSPLLDEIGGLYFFNCNEAEVVEGRTTDMSGVAPYALDSANADQLWDESVRLISS